eukprot:3697876-Pleurochrysis_carterae.AAC.2
MTGPDSCGPRARATYLPTVCIQTIYPDAVSGRRFCTVGTLNDVDIVRLPLAHFCVELGPRAHRRAMSSCLRHHAGEHAAVRRSAHVRASVGECALV